VLKAFIVAFAEAAAGRDEGKLASNCVQTLIMREAFLHRLSSAEYS
jgi:hypothetical protein